MNRSSIIGHADLARLLARTGPLGEELVAWLRMQRVRRDRPPASDDRESASRRSRDHASGGESGWPVLAGTFEVDYWLVASERSIARDTDAKTTDVDDIEHGSPHRSRSPPLEHVPLLSDEQCVQLVRSLLDEERQGRRVDERKLIRTISRAMPVRHMPRRRRRDVLGEVIVLIDASSYLQPLHADHRRFTESIRRCYGHDLVRWVKLPVGPEGPWIERRSSGAREFDGLIAPSRIVALSDFGRARGRGHRVHRAWERSLDRLEQAGHRLNCLTLSSASIDRSVVSALVSAMACLSLPCPARLRRLRLVLNEVGIACGPNEELHAWNHSDRDPLLRDQWTMRRSEALAWQRRFVALRPRLWRDALHAAIKATRNSKSDEAAAVEQLVMANLGLEKPPHPALFDALAQEDERVGRDSGIVEPWFGAVNELLATIDTAYADDDRYRSLYVQAASVAMKHRYAPPSGVEHVTATLPSGGRLCIEQHGPYLRVVERERPTARTLWHTSEPCLDVATGVVLTEGAEFGADDVTIRSRTHEVRFEKHRRERWAEEVSWREGGLEMTHDSGSVFRYIGASRRDGEPWRLVKDEFPWATASGVDRYGLWAEFSIENTTHRLRWIPPGEFLMGSPPNEPERDDNETQHRVTLTQGYWLAETACPQSLWQAVMGENPSRFKGEDLPVENVTWDDVQAFTERLNERLPGLHARLPTEAEWEHAARAGTRTAFWWGDELTPERANYDGNHPYANGEKGEYREKTVEVKRFEANPWGLYQVHGNVREWCSDQYGKYGEGDTKDPAGPEAGEHRVCRGGSWSGNGRWLRAAYRRFHPLGYRYHDLGVRLAAGQQTGFSFTHKPKEDDGSRRALIISDTRIGFRKNDWIFF